MSTEECAVFIVMNVRQTPDEAPRISIRHEPSGKTIEATGAVLEAQFVSGGRYVLFISEGTPYEEALHVLLLNADMQVLDALELSAAYTAGMLRNVSLVQPNIIRFSFFEPGEIWHLEVAERSHVRLWGNNHPVRRHSPLLHRTWLKLNRQSGGTGRASP